MSDTDGIYPSPDQYTETVSPSPSVEAMTDGRLHIEWRNGLTANVSAIDKRRGELRCELRLYIEHMGIQMAPRRINLLSDSAITTVRRALAERFPGQDWPVILEQLVIAVDQHSRTTKPAVHFSRVDRGVDVDWAIEPLLARQQPCILSADGGTGKTTLAMGIGLSVATGYQFVPKLRVDDPGPVLMCDWEDTEEPQQVTVSRIASVADVDIGSFHYMECAGPLAEIIDNVKAEADRVEAKLVIIDSLSWAAGGDLEKQETVDAYARAIRSLNVATINIAHVAKNGDHERPFGSSFWWNFARNIWSLERHSDLGSDVVNLQLVHRKANKTKLRQPIGLRMDFGSWPIHFQAIDPADVRQFRKSHGGAAQDRELVEYLEQVGEATDAQIADQTYIPKANIREVVRRCREKGLIDTRYEGRTAVRMIRNNRSPLRERGGCCYGFP